MLVAVGTVAHGSLLVITTVTWSLFARVDEVNVADVSAGTVVPFIFHTYVGAAPPLTGVALKVTLPPAQMVVVVDVMVTDGVTLEAVI